MSETENKYTVRISYSLEARHHFFFLVFLSCLLSVWTGHYLAPHLGLLAQLATYCFLPYAFFLTLVGLWLKHTKRRHPDLFEIKTDEQVMSHSFLDSLPPSRPLGANTFMEYFFPPLQFFRNIYQIPRDLVKWFWVTGPWLLVLALHTKAVDARNGTWVRAIAPYLWTPAFYTSGVLWIAYLCTLNGCPAADHLFQGVFGAKTGCSL
jgi:hypothetical protein